AFPADVLARVGNANNGLNAWKLAGAGWKQVLRDNLKEVLARTTGSLNTPKTAQVEELFEKTIGLSNLSSLWRWHGSNPKKAAEKLDDLVTLRGSIAHRVSAAREVLKTDVQQAAEFVLRLGAASSNAVRAHLRVRTGEIPWDEYSPDIKGK